MCQMISCLVSRSGEVHAVDGVHSHSEIASKLGIDEDKCLKYEFHLKERELFQDFNSDSAPFEARASHDKAAMDFFMECSKTPEKLADFVRRGNWSEKELLSLLSYEALKKYEEVHAPAWKKYKEVCDSAWKKYKEVCDSAWKKYEEVCAEEWIELFLNSENRIENWK